MTCLMNLIKLMAIGIVVMVVGFILLAAAKGAGWMLGFIIGLAIIGALFSKA